MKLIKFFFFVKIEKTHKEWEREKEREIHKIQHFIIKSNIEYRINFNNFAWIVQSHYWNRFRIFIHFVFCRFVCAIIAIFFQYRLESWSTLVGGWLKIYQMQEPHELHRFWLVQKNSLQLNAFSQNPHIIFIFCSAFNVNNSLFNLRTLNR